MEFASLLSFAMTEQDQERHVCFSDSIIFLPFFFALLQVH